MLSEMKPLTTHEGLPFTEGRATSSGRGAFVPFSPHPSFVGACHSPTPPSTVGGLPSSEGRAAGSYQGTCSPPTCVTAGREGAALASAASSLFPRMIAYKLDVLDELIEHLGEEFATDEHG